MNKVFELSIDDLYTLSQAGLRKMISTPSPSEWLAIAEESAGRPRVGKRHRPDHTCRALFDRARRVRPSHLGRHPARADGVDQNARRLKFVGQHAGERVQRSLRDAVGGCAT